MDSLRDSGQAGATPACPPPPPLFGPPGKSAAAPDHVLDGERPPSEGDETGRRSYYKSPDRRRNPRWKPHATRKGLSYHPARQRGDQEQERSSKLPVWNGAVRWLASVEEALDTPEGDAARRAMKVKRSTLLDVAELEAKTADARTGRGVMTAHRTVARLLGCSVSTVRRARDLLSALGYARTIEVGRYLTAAERQEATAAHGGRQLRIASHRVLITPRSDQNEQLPQRGSFELQPLVRKYPPKCAHARTRAASRTVRRKKRVATRSEASRSLAIQRLAAHFTDYLPWTTRFHVGSLCQLLVTVGVDPNEWTAFDLYEALNRRNAASGKSSITPDQQRDPLALLAHQLKDVLNSVQETPQQRRRREEQDRVESAARRRAEAQHRAEVEAQRRDPDVQRSIAQSIAIARSAAAAATQARKNKNCGALVQVETSDDLE